MAQHPATDLERRITAPTDAASSDREAGAAGLAERGAALASEAGHQKAQEAAFYAELGYEETRDLVRGYPLQALGIAAGVGVLVGLLMARR